MIFATTKIVAQHNIFGTDFQFGFFSE